MDNMLKTYIKKALLPCRAFFMNIILILTNPLVFCETSVILILHLCNIKRTKQSLTNKGIHIKTKLPCNTILNTII